MIYIEENIYYKLRLDEVLTFSLLWRTGVPLINSGLHLRGSREGQRPPSIKIHNCNNITIILIATRWTTKVPIINFHHFLLTFSAWNKRVFRINKLNNHSMFLFLSSIQNYKLRYFIKYNLSWNSLGSLSTFPIKFFRFSRSVTSEFKGVLGRKLYQNTI